MRIFLTLAGLFCLSILPAQTRHYVNASATGQNTGQSWADAFTGLQPALQAAQAGDEVWVAAGTYFPTPDTNRDSFFEVPSGVGLYGGFGGVETDLAQRDWEAHPTVLSGDIGLPGDSTDNSYTIVYMENPDSTTVLDGFRLLYGNADYAPSNVPATSPSKCGGALYIQGTNGWAYALVRHCYFGRNYAHSQGGAVFVNGSGTGSVAPQFLSCSFERNRSRLDGGALYRNGGSWAERVPDFGGCVFLDNTAGRRGGGLCYNESERSDRIDLSGCSFLRNRSNLSGGGANFNIGRATGTNISLTGCVFDENDNTSTGGSDGNAIALASLNGLGMGQFWIDSCSFVNNVQGIIIWDDVLGDGSMRLTNSVLSSEGGSTMEIAQFAECHMEKNQFDRIIIRRNYLFVFRSNVARWSSMDVEDGVIDISNNVFHGNASAFFLINTQVSFRNNTLASGNWLAYVGSEATVSFENSILHRPFKLQLSSLDKEVRFSHCLFEDDSYCPSTEPFVTCGPGNLFNLDPLFRDTANGDYSLLPCSPLINAGSNAAAAGILTDIAGAPRIQGGTVDIGAYESPAFALAAEPSVKPACTGASDGSIVISPVFGCEPYTYAWVPNAGNGPELEGLPPGDYAFTVTDGSGRQVSDTVTVSPAPTPGLSLAATDVTCGLPSGGSLSASVSGGTAPFGYEWSPAAADTSLLTQQPPGDYSLTVVDAHGCRDSAMASIALVGQITLGVDGSTISCHGAADGWLSATPLTGAAPFSWEWLGWPGTAQVAEPLGPGQYAVTVSDAYGCTASFAFPPMTEPAPLSIGTGSSAQTQSDPPDGAAVVTTVSGGTQPFGFAWSPGGESTQAIAGLLAGTYTVTVTDKNGCSISAEVVVELMLSATGEAGEGAFLLYPNPSAERVRAVLPPGDWRLEVSDGSGRVVLSEECGSDCVLDLGGLPGGTYVLTARQGEKTWTGRALKR